ncbi:MAG: putative integrin-like protein [Myxococcaceae bacterium]|nr:putative integrin-like protein [Myxococcaceae bacterium]
MPNRYPRVEFTALIVACAAVACVPEITVRPGADGGAAASDLGTGGEVDDRPAVAVDAPTDDRPAPSDVVDVAAVDVAADAGDDAPGDSGPTDSGACPLASTRCGTDCVATATDARNCGGCGVDCRALPHVTGAAAVGCVAGACVVPASACEAGWGHCEGPVGGGCETRLATADHCGACGQRCAGETPVCSAATAACASGCAATQTRCGASCVDPQEDISHCGACGRACPVVLNARSVCAGGACGFACVSGYHRCGDRCADDASPSSCGSSCVACLAPAGAAATCAAGQCGYTCPPGQHRCGDRCADNASVLTCGAACGACAVPANGSATCDGTACGVSCDAGYVRSGAACVALAAPRPVAPLSTARVTNRRPLLNWALAAATDGARVELCRQRACTTVALTIDAAGGSGTPGRELEPGVWFWRLRGRAAGATGLVAGPTWQFEVGARSAPAGRSWGTTSDFNGDGYADVVVGAPGANGGAGRVHIYRGSATGVGATPSQTLNGPVGSGGSFGGAVACAGDVNGDGFADLVVGSQTPSLADGHAYIYLGGVSGVSASPSLALSDPGGSNGGFGYSVTNAGDLNGDGYADIAVSARTKNGYVGRVYVYHGSATGILAMPTLGILGPDGANGLFGHTLASADFDGDGYADLVVGAIGVEPAPGRIHVFAGRPIGLSTTPVTTLIGASASGFGSATPGVGDVNGDGYADLVVGSPTAQEEAGYVQVYLGSTTGLGRTPVATLNDPVGGVALYGTSVSSHGDLNGDGYSDVVVGALTRGQVFMYWGGPGTISTSNGRSQFSPTGGTARFGVAVTTGDVNGDGYSDVIAGEDHANLNVGRVHVLFGARDGDPVPASASLNGPDGAGGYFGSVVGR